MKRPVPKAAAVHDLSGYGRASLTVALPVLASMGVQTCPLPTALLSTQTSGFSGYHYRDLTEDMHEIIRHWKSLELQFAGIYSGFLGSARQISCVTEFIREFALEDTLVVVDPVMGDDGQPYGPISQELIRGMRDLVSHARVITPNVTETCLLLDEPFPEKVGEDRVFSWIARLLELGPKQAVITSVPVAGMPERCMVYAGDAEAGVIYRLDSPLLPAKYPGSGDMFASVLTGALLQDESFPEAVAKAGDCVQQAISEALRDRVPQREGLLIEPVLARLSCGPVALRCEEAASL